MAGRKFGIGDYGLLSYDLGPPIMHPWEDASIPPSEPWVPEIPLIDPWAPVSPPVESWIPVETPVYQSSET